MKPMQKKIKVLTSGIIRVKGYMCGPILTPYFEDIDTICKMLAENIKVVEVCDDGTEAVLTISNVGNDNSETAKRKAAELKKKAAEERKKAAAVEKEPESTIVFENPEVTVESSDVKEETPAEHTIVADETPKYNNNRYDKYQKNKGKNR